jgi:cytochrome c peroxidase
MVPNEVRPRLELLRSRLTPGRSMSGTAVVALGLALYVVSGALQASAAQHLVPMPAPAPNQEPITAIPSPPIADPLKLTLGERLFQDPGLSLDGTRACSSCHNIQSNGADGLRNATDANGTSLALNTLSVFNAALNFRLNWEGNYRTLEAQAESFFNDTHGVKAGTQEVLSRLNADAEISGQFRAAYGHRPDRVGLLDALATYERSLVTPGSRFDRWLGGDAAALSPEEQRGYQLFKSAGCVSCHQGVNIGGNLFERHGIFRPLAATEPNILRVPSLRNVATTAPYFHDGSAPTLADAVRRMAVAQLDQSLSDPEVDSIVAFLKTLTGDYRGAPVTAAAK